jgi:hypothetical protein
MSASGILGISAFYHDSVACLLRDGEIIAAAQEKRFTRKKGDRAFPTQAVKFCLDVAWSINAKRSLMPNAGIASELWAFMRVRKKWWLLPIIIVMLLVGGLCCSPKDRSWLRSSIRFSELIVAGPHLRA